MATKTEALIRCAELDASGLYGVGEIAEIVGVSIGSVSKWRNHNTQYQKLVQDYQQERRLEMDARIKNFAFGALNSLYEIIKDKSNPVDFRTRAILELLDRAGVTKDTAPKEANDLSLILEKALQEPQSE